MSRRMLLVIALLGACRGDLSAQWNLARLQPGESRVHATMALDPAFIPSVGYDRVTSLFGRTTLFGVEGGVVVGGAELRDFRVRLNSDVQLLQFGNFRVAGRASFLTRGTSNSVFRAVNFGADIGATAGFYRQRWFLASEVGFDKAVVTRLTHTQGYRDRYYADAKDGWYLDNGGTIRAGLVTGVAVRGAELMMRFGIPRTQGGQELMAPAYLTLGVGFGF